MQRAQKKPTGDVYEVEAHELFDGKDAEYIAAHILGMLLIDEVTDEDRALADAAERIFADELRAYREAKAAAETRAQAAHVAAYLVGHTNPSGSPPTSPTHGEEYRPGVHVGCQVHGCAKRRIAD
jgi:hypothetical protein